MFIKSRRQVNQNNRPLRKLRSASQVLLNGTPGIYYDIQNQMECMYKTSTGEELVTAAGDSVGLVLDSRYGLVRASETWQGELDVRNPGWTDNGGGQYEVDSSSILGARIGIDTAIPAGTAVECLFNIESLTSGSLAVKFIGATDGPAINTPGMKRLILFPDGDVTEIGLVVKTGSTEAVVSGVSFRVIPGYHAVQDTDGDRTVLGREPLGVGRINLIDNSYSIAGLSEIGTALATSLGGGEFSATGLDTTSSDGISYVAQESIDIEGKTHIGQVEVKAASETEVGKDVRLTVKRQSGGSNSFDIATVTLTSEFQKLDASFTGIAGNEGVRLIIHASTTNGIATDDTIIFRRPMIEDSTSYSDTTLPSTYQTVVSPYDVTQSGIPDLWYLSGNGTNQFMPIPGSAAYLKFLHDGTNGRVVGAYSYDSEDTGSLAAFYGNRQVTGDTGSTSYVSDTGSLDARLTRYISNGSTDIVDQASADMAIPRYSPFIHDSYYGESLSPEAATLVDGQVVSSGDAVGAPSTSDADFDMALMARNGTSGVGLFFPGKLYGITFIAGASEQQTSQLTQFYASEVGITL